MKGGIKMIAIDWSLDILKNKYLQFDGRAGRPEYWFFFLAVLVVSIILSIIDSLLTGFLLSAIFSLAILLPSLAVCVRRFHDQDRSGWFALLLLIPAVGVIIVLVLMALPGSPGANRFGPLAPKSPAKTLSL